MKQDFRNTIRQDIKNIRQQLSMLEIEQLSHKIINHIICLPEYQKSQNIALYLSVNGEVDLTLLWKDAFQQHKKCYFPIINNKTLNFGLGAIDGNFKPNKFGILEPEITDESQIITNNQLDIIFMPLIAFNNYGNRLGSGGGFYDRTLINNSSQLIGVAYDFQQTDKLSSNQWDIPMHKIITNLTTMDFT